MSIENLLKLRTLLASKGIEVASDGTTPDPFDSQTKVVVRDARAFGHQPIVDGISTGHTIAEYLEEWGIASDDDTTKQFVADIFGEVDALGQLERQDQCTLSGDELKCINPEAFLYAKEREGELHITLRLNLKYAYVNDGNKEYVFDDESKNQMSVKAFKNRVRSDYIIVGEKKDAKPIQSSDIWMQSPARRTYDGTEFVPHGVKTDGAVSREKKRNLFHGFPPHIWIPGKGDSLPIQTHIVDVLHDGNETTANYEFNWQADIRLNPQRKPHVALVRTEPEGGSGKDIIAALLYQHVVGPDYSTTLVGMEALTQKHNSELAHNLLVIGTELTWGGDHRSRDRLFAETGSPTRCVEPKGIDRRTVPNYSRFILHSNSDRAVAVAGGDRRFLVTESRSPELLFPNGGSESKEYLDYYAALSRACHDPLVVAAYIRFLESRNLDGFNPFRAPMTEAKLDLIERNLEARNEWIVGVACRGGFMDSAGTFHPIDDFPEAAGWRNQIPARVVEESAAMAFAKHNPNASLDRAVGKFLGKQRNRPDSILAEKDYVGGEHSELIPFPSSAISGGNKIAVYRFPPLSVFRKRIATRVNVPMSRLTDGTAGSIADYPADKKVA